MLILIRYGEIGLKSSQVRSGFEQRLKDNLAQQLQYRGIDGDIVEHDDRIFADVDTDDAADAALALSNVPGVVSVSPVKTCDLDMDAIVATATDVVQHRIDDTTETFAVDARRAGEHDFDSKDIENQAGDSIRTTHDLAVDLDEPDVTVHVEARYTEAYVYTEIVDGVGGLPVNEDNTVVVAMTDRTATVAAYRLLKRGCAVYPVYWGNEPEQLDEDMATLRQFDPATKLTVIDAADRNGAVKQAAALFDVDAVALPVTADDLDDYTPPETDAEVLLPNCGHSTDAVMETYGDIRHAPI